MGGFGLENAKNLAFCLAHFGEDGHILRCLGGDGEAIEEELGGLVFVAGPTCGQTRLREAHGGEHIVCRDEGAGAEDEFEGAAESCGRPGWVGHDAEGAAEASCGGGGATCAALLTGFDDDGGGGEGGEQLIALMEAKAHGGSLGGCSREDGAALFEDAVEEAEVLAGVEHVEAAAYDDDGGGVGFEGGVVGGRVDANGAAGPDGEAASREVVDEATSKGESLGARATSADYGDTGGRGERTAEVEDGRGFAELVESGRVVGMVWG